MTEKSSEKLIDRLIRHSQNGKRLSDRTPEEWAELRRAKRAREIIKDNEWIKLKLLANMSDGDRDDIESAVRTYRNNVGDRLGSPTLTSAETREQFELLGKEALNLHKSIEKVLENDHAARLISSPADVVWENTKVWALSDSLEEFSRMILSASERCGSTRPGPRNENLWGLVSTLAQFWSSSVGEPLSISKKRCGPNRSSNGLEFITLAVQIADPAMKDADTKIRDIVKNTARMMKSGES